MVQELSKAGNCARNHRTAKVDLLVDHRCGKGDTDVRLARQTRNISDMKANKNDETGEQTFSHHQIEVKSGHLRYSWNESSNDRKFSLGIHLELPNQTYWNDEYKDLGDRINGSNQYPSDSLPKSVSTRATRVRLTKLLQKLLFTPMSWSGVQSITTISIEATPHKTHIPRQISHADFMPSPDNRLSNRITDTLARQRDRRKRIWLDKAALIRGTGQQSNGIKILDNADLSNTLNL
jgi:hypothetical protein